MAQLTAIENHVAAATETNSSAYVPPLQPTLGQPAPIAANGGLSYMSFDQDGDAGTAAAMEEALRQIAEGEGQAVIDMIDNARPGPIETRWGVGFRSYEECLDYIRAQVRRIMWIIAADTQPYQNIPFIIQAIGEWGMTKAPSTEHPLRLHFIRREFGAIEHIMSQCAGKFSVGDSITYSDCFIVPQVRNGLLAGIDLPSEFPTLNCVWENMLAVPEVHAVLDQAGGVVQPLFFDEEKFEVYADNAKPERGLSL